MLLVDFFIKRHSCSHDKFTPEKDIGYCPDCGELIENRWFIMRCACCGVKIKAVLKNGAVLANEKFCHNCGCKNFVAERIDKINFIDINYAVLVKTVIPNEIKPYTQTWADVKENCTHKLLQQIR